MSQIYTPSERFGGASNSVDMTKCRASVWHRVGTWGHNSQCIRKAVIEENGYGWCKQHAPSTVKARDEAKRKGWDEEADARSWGYEKERLEREMVSAALAWHKSGTDGVFDVLTSLTNACEALRLHLEGKPS